MLFDAELVCYINNEEVYYFKYPVYLPKKLPCLQKVLNSCVRFIYGLHGHQDDYLPYLRETHILPIEQRVVFKACLMAYKIIHGSAPDYLCEQIPVDNVLDVPRRTRATTVPDLFKLQYP